MNRKIEMYFKYNKELDTAISIYLVTEYENRVSVQAKEYNLIYDKNITLDENRANFYNQMLVDFKAEYDDELAFVIDKIVNKIM